MKDRVQTPAPPKKPGEQNVAGGCGWWRPGLIVLGIIIVLVIRNSGSDSGPRPTLSDSGPPPSFDALRRAYDPAPVPAPVPTPVPELDVEVRRTDTQLIVLNRSTERWTNCTVEINPGIIRGGWSTGPVTIEPGETVRGGLRTFTKSGGERFDPLTHAVESAFVECDTPRGRAYWSGIYR